MLPPADVPRGEDGRPLAPAFEARTARAVAIVAATWFALAAGWEMFGPILAGHYASSASVGIIAENMLRWHISGPVWEYTTARPGPDAYYCHHPWGIFWTTAVFMKIFGRHDFVCRLAPVLLSAATPPLLYDLGRSIWRPAAGAAAAAAFVVLPIALAFASFNALEVPVIAWTLLFLWGFVRLTQTGKRRHLAASLAGLFFALHADWPAFVLAGEVLAFTFARSLLLRGVFGPLGPRARGVPDVVRERRFAAFWLGAAAISVGTVALYLAVFSHAHKLGDLFGSAETRSAGGQQALAKVLASRRYWIELSFTPIAIFLGKVGAVVCAARLVFFRREHEVLPLAVLGMAVVQYVVFKQGADVHVFWPHYFAPYFALAMGALVASIADAIERLLPWLRARLGRPVTPATRAGVVALGLALVPILFIARDGIPALRYARGTGGRFNEKGLLIHSDGAKTAFLAWLSAQLPKRAAIEMHEGMKTTWAQVWALGGRIVASNRAPPAGHGRASDVYLADTRFMYDEVQGDLAQRFHVVAVGPFWKIGRGDAAAPIDAFAIDEREPGPLTWYFVSGTEPERTIRPDPFRTWELREHFGQAAEPPSAPPTTLDERRIAYDVAIARGDLARAAELLAAIRAELRPIGAAFDDGSEIVGATFVDGARPLLTLYVKAGGPTTDDVQLAVKSKVLARATLSTTVADPTEREVGLPLAIAPKRWRKDFLYVDPVPIRKRPGHEVFKASFWARGRATPPRPVAGPHDVVVLDLD